MKKTPFNFLVIEDDPAFLNLVTRLLDEMFSNAVIKQTSLGLEGISLFERQKPYDLVIVDLGLPDINGLEVILKINQLDPNVTILVMSVLSSENSLFEAINCGSRGYILKDESEESIRKSISESIKGNYPISPMLARFLFKYAKQDKQDKQDKQGKYLGLSPKELLVLENIAKGNSYFETAQNMKIKQSTVQTHIRRLYKKLNVHSQIEAVNKAGEIGLI